MQTLEEIRAQRNRALSFKHILPLQKQLESLNAIPQEELTDIKFYSKDCITLEIPHLSAESFKNICAVAKALIPWRKGPFRINELEILSEWNSAIKYNILEPHLDLENKILGDVGCNNGYYMFRATDKNPKRVVGFDPMPLCFLQFKFLQFFANIAEERLNFELQFELLGIEDLCYFENSFDVLLCLGVLYHRKSPLDAIKMIFNGLKKGGEAIFDSLIISRDEEIALCPNGRYAKMPNVYFIPTLRTFEYWLKLSGFREITHIATLKTAFCEQRRTEWSANESLEDFLDSSKDRTIEGYPAPMRAYIKARKIN